MTRVFANCNVCGKPLRTKDEEEMGMCEHCAYDWQDEAGPDGDLDEPIGSCDECGCNLYPDDDDGSGLCDQCRFYLEGR